MTPFQILRVAHLLPGAWIISRRRSMDEWEKNYRVLQRYSRKAIKAFGFELHVQGAEELPTQGPLFFVSNHQGTLDPAPIVASCPIPLAFISKKENESIPLLGRWAQLIGTIHFDRETREGNEMHAFKMGSLQPAYMGKAAIVPVTLKHCYALDEKKSHIRSISVIYGKPIPYEEYGKIKQEELLTRLHDEIQRNVYAR